MDFRLDTAGHALAFAGTPPDVAVLDVLNRESWVYECVEAPGEVMRRLRGDPSIDIVLIFPRDPPTACIQLCRDIKLDRRFSFLGVVFVLSEQLESVLRDMYKAGANDCITRSRPAEEIGQRLSNALRAKRATDTLEDSAAVLTSLAAAIEGRDPYTHGHVERVADYCVQIGKSMGLGGGELGALRFGGLVHDIGKVAIPDGILNKPGPLDVVEMEIVKRHPVVGYDILKSSRTFVHVLPIVRWHHERPNGKGYPDGLRGDKIPVAARITAVADVFDGLGTARPYRSALGLDRCKEILLTMGEAGDLDGQIVAALLGILTHTSTVMSGAPSLNAGVL